MGIDLSTVQMHLDNFVDTQEGWYKILSGVTDILSGNNLKEAAKEPIKALSPSVARELTHYNPKNYYTLIRGFLRHNAYGGSDSAAGVQWVNNH